MRIGQGDRLVSSFVTGLSLSSFQVGLDDLCRDFGRYCLGLLQLQGLDKVMTNQTVVCNYSFMLILHGEVKAIGQWVPTLLLVSHKGSSGASLLSMQLLRCLGDSFIDWLRCVCPMNPSCSLQMPCTLDGC